MFTNLLVVLPACLVFSQLSYLLYTSITSPLRSIPGPFLARFTKLWYLWRVYNGHFEHDNIALHARYGKIVRYGPNEYSIDDPAAAKIIYGHGTHFTKSSWYSGWALPGRWSLFTDLDPQHHGQERRKYQTTYSMSSLVTYEPFVDDCAHIFSQRLEEMVAQGVEQPRQSAALVDMGHWFQCYAFDVIGAITFSRRFGFLDSGKDVDGLMGAVNENMVYSTLIGIYSWLVPYFHRATAWFNLNGATGKARLYAFMGELVARRKAENKSKHVAGDDTADEKGSSTTATGSGQAPKDFLAKFLEAHAADQNRFTDYNVFVGMVGNIIAGSDTTSSTLSGILYHLLKNPAAMSKLQQEIDEFHQADKISEPITFKESQSMPYFQAVIKEAQRLHPATGLPLPRVVPAGGANICGRFFPEGTVVGINAWVAHHNKSVFGPDADEFRPERWLPPAAPGTGESDEQEAKRAAMEGYYMPFGLGSRTCIGKHISILEMSKLIPTLLLKFDFALGDSTSNKWTTENYWFVKPVGFIVRVSLREKREK